ncbi:hypothetical protein DPMN_180027 [Dreissena polymorpha]|uniref:Uncharacterized protein n=1 Tax=Dreissena polymorpha TaxID=45954 RepID=A0A9D4EI78_DREPO|nr:hypothetical protein DPMN_180027 [Dreissena polymorpha]
MAVQKTYLSRNKVAVRSPCSKLSFSVGLSGDHTTSMATLQRPYHVPNTTIASLTERRKNAGLRRPL